MAEFRYHDIHRLAADEVLKRMETASGGLSPEEARLRLSETCWLGVGNGHGRLRARRARVGCRRGTAPERFTEMWLHESGVSPAAMPGAPGAMPDDAALLGDATPFVSAVPFADAAVLPLAAGGL